MKFCTECGAQLADGVKFCTECGAKLAVPVPPPATVYEEPMAPVYEEPSAPAVPVYEEPAAPVYEEPAAPAVPVYEEPAAPVYEEPAAPAAPIYEAPAQGTYTPPVASAPPVQAAYTPATTKPKAEKPAKAPKAPKEKRPFNKKLIPIIAGVAVVLILLIALLGGGKNQGTEADWGVYEGVSCVVSGMDLGADGEWVELQKKGKATLFIMGEEYSAKWTLDGEKLVIKQGGDEFIGTLKNGTIEVDMAGMLYTFRKPGAAAPEVNQGGASLKPTEKEPETPEKADGPVTYKLISFTMDGEEMGADMVEMMGGGYVVFNGDGTGVFAMFGDTFPITYTETEIDAAGEKMPYKLTDSGMEFGMEGSTFILEVTDETPDLTVPSGGEEEADKNEGGILSWNGDYYGFWVVDSVWDASHDWVEEGAYWDACATVELNEDGTGMLTIWDEDFEKAEPLAELGITVSETGGVARFCGEEGFFLGEPLAHADWLWYTDATEYGDLFVINGQFDDGEDDFWYEIYLRPWGTDWSDVLANDPDMKPYYYDDWYLPMIDSGVTEAPVGKVGQ